MQSTKFEMMALVVLSLMLVSVFVLSISMYEDIAANTEDGALATFAESVRNFFDENEAVAAFLGIDEHKNFADDNNTAAKAAAYIERYNGIYARNK